MLGKARKYLQFFPEIIIFLFALSTRFVNLNYPKSHMFDEVYHAFTAQRISLGDPKAWEWWNTPPSGFAYEWTHPPLAKEFMAIAISIFGDSSFAWRFFSALFGTLAIVVIYFIARKLFNRKIAVLSIFVASLDGLLLVMSRIAMNDSYFLFFSLLALFFFLVNRKFLMGLSLGLAIASKWTGFFVIAFLAIFYIFRIMKENLKGFEILKMSLFLFVIPLLIYLLSYVPFFLQKHSPPYSNFSNTKSFVELQKQMYWYHTNLRATHPYQSRPQDWVLNLKPVWIFTESRNNLVSNIYALGNPLFMLGGLVSIVILIYGYLKKRRFNLFFVLLSYFFFFIPWIFSPRIMFNYHYLLSSAFLAIAQGVVLFKFLENKSLKSITFFYLIAISFLFFYFYPLWTGVFVDKSLYDSYFWLKSWR